MIQGIWGGKQPVPDSAHGDASAGLPSPRRAITGWIRTLASERSRESLARGEAEGRIAIALVARALSVYGVGGRRHDPLRA